MIIVPEKVETAKAPEWGEGKSKAAGKRRAERNRGRVATGNPGETINLSDRSYYVRPDGSLKRIRLV